MAIRKPLTEAERLARIEETILVITADKWRAHEVIFSHRHQLNGHDVLSAPFHRAFVDDFWSASPHSIILAFRGSAKSTYMEEDATLALALRAYRNILIIGSSEARAAERLAAVSYELGNNQFITDHFGIQA